MPFENWSQFGKLGWLLWWFDIFLSLIGRNVDFWTILVCSEKNCFKIDAISYQIWLTQKMHHSDHCRLNVLNFLPCFLQVLTRVWFMNRSEMTNSFIYFMKLLFSVCFCLHQQIFDNRIVRFFIYSLMYELKWSDIQIFRLNT